MQNTVVLVDQRERERERQIGEVSLSFPIDLSKLADGEKSEDRSQSVPMTDDQRGRRQRCVLLNGNLMRGAASCAKEATCFSHCELRKIVFLLQFESVAERSAAIRPSVRSEKKKKKIERRDLLLRADCFDRISTRITMLSSFY